MSDTLKRISKLVPPTPEEDAEIRAAALADPDAQPMTEEMLAQLKPFRSAGRPKQEVVKKQITLRLDDKVVDFFRKQGPGWQTQLNDVLVEHVDKATRKVAPKRA